MTIKPWNSQVTQTTTLGEQLVLMQTEIDELREVLTNVCVTLERVQKERDSLALEKIKQHPVPEGMALVPLSPTPHMQSAFINGNKSALLSGHDHYEAFYVGYKSMLEVAKQ